MVAEELADLLVSNGLSLAVAESCTGGMISSMISDVPGSSRYFLAGLVTYSDDSKISLLGVRKATLIEHGAVSQAVAGEMAAGVRTLMRSDIGISATGIAGPEGATEEKPVGLVEFAMALEGRIVSDRRVFSGDRQEVKRAASEHALRMIIEELE